MSITSITPRQAAGTRSWGIPKGEKRSSRPLGRQCGFTPQWRYNLIRQFSFVGLVVAALLLSGCARNPYMQSKQAIQQTKQKVHRMQSAADITAPAVVMDKGYFVDPRPISIKRAPKWLQQHVDLHASGLPFRLINQQLLRNAPVAVAYDSSVNQGRAITMNYRGTIGGALKRLGSLTNYHYTFNASGVQWSAFETRTFNISFMPGNSNYLVGGQGGNQAVSRSGGGVGGTSVVTLRPDLGDDQYSNLTGRLSIWDDMRSTLNKLKSPQGKVFVSESTTTVTVHDHPANVVAMARYIKKLNTIMGEEVNIKVQVLELSLDKEFNLGINWNLVEKALDTTFTLSGSLADATSIMGTAAQQAGTSGAMALQIGSDESNALINALNQQGQLSVVTQPTVMTMNNQIAAVRITRDTAYLESISNTAIADSSNVTTSLTPGVVTDGFTLYLLPKIDGNKVYMQISSTLSTLTSLTKISNSPEEEGDSNDRSSFSFRRRGRFQAIQVPTIDEKHFNQRTMVQSGSTLIIAGFKQLRDAIKEAGLAGTDIPGSAGSERRNVETIVLITPVIIHQHNS